MKPQKTISLAVAFLAPLFAQAALIDSFEDTTVFTNGGAFTPAFVTAPGVTHGSKAWELVGSATSYVLAFQSFSGTMRTALGGDAAAEGATITIDFRPVGSEPATFAGLALQLSGSAGSNLDLGNKFVGLNSTGTVSWTLDAAAAAFVRNSTGFFGLQFYRNSNLGATDPVYVDNFTLTPAVVVDQDSNGDGILDSEVTALGLDPAVNYSALLNIVITNPGRFGITTAQTVINDPAAFGLYTPASIMDLNLGGLVLEKTGSSGILRLQVQASNDLAVTPFADLGDPVEFTVPMSGNKHFFRVRAVGAE
jgi:hypothetical protein